MSKYEMNTISPDDEMPARSTASHVDNSSVKPVFYANTPEKSRRRSESSDDATFGCPLDETIETGLINQVPISRRDSRYSEKDFGRKRKDEAFKTALCDAFKRTGHCGYGELCCFAHGDHELRLPPQARGKAHPKYKTQLCDKYSQNAWCPYGPRCQFIHKTMKGFSLVEYQRRLEKGEISPARENEIRLLDQSPGRASSRGWQGMNADDLSGPQEAYSDRMFSRRRHSNSAPSGLMTAGSGFGGRNAVVYEDATGHEERRSLEFRKQRGVRLWRAASNDSLEHYSHPLNTDKYEMRQCSSRPDLSCINEDPEEDYSQHFINRPKYEPRLRRSQPPSQVSTQRPMKWQQQLFGRTQLSSIEEANFSQTTMNTDMDSGSYDDQKSHYGSARYTKYHN